jgi:hypothetical protein
MQQGHRHGLRDIQQFLDTAQSAEAARRKSQMSPTSPSTFSEDKRMIVAKIKDLICDPRGGGASDLMKMGKEIRTTLGMHIALNSGMDHLLPRQVQSVIPVSKSWPLIFLAMQREPIKLRLMCEQGGPAHLSGQIQRGDEIIAVDGHNVDENR